MTHMFYFVELISVVGGTKFGLKIDITLQFSIVLCF